MGTLGELPYYSLASKIRGGAGNNLQGDPKNNLVPKKFWVCVKGNELQNSGGLSGGVGALEFPPVYFD